MISSQTLTPMTQPEDMAQSRERMQAFIAVPAQLPFSFVYDETTYHGIPAAWNPVVTTRRIDANITERVYVGADVATGLTMRVELLEYLDFPVVEWTVWFENMGDAPTPVLRDIRALDAAFTGEEPVLTHSNGDYAHKDGYTPREAPLPAGTALTLAPFGGRACDQAFPYFRLQFAGCGMTLSVGWPAQWAATFTGLTGGVSVQAGQQQTHLRLLPGERIRTPRMTVMSWVGDNARAINLWRRWYLAHVLPRTDGCPLPPLLVGLAVTDLEEFTGATEEEQLRYQEKYARLGIDYDVWWIDAGWYPCWNARGERQWPITGTWEPDPERFPRGLRPIAENAVKHGARLLLWFEPERVAAGSQLDREHPEWLLRIPHEEAELDGAQRYFANTGVTESKMLNLGDPACRQWLTDHVCALIQQHGIGVYRQDFNYAPLLYWQRHDADDRRGMTENLYVQGYLQYWDDLLARNPGLWIDSCSSGGRRNDLETMRRSVPLHFSDHGHGVPLTKLGFMRILFEWLPYFKNATISWEHHAPEDDRRFNIRVDSYDFHCSLAAMLLPAVDIRRDDYDYPLCRQLIDLWRRAADTVLNGDYYPLTPYSRDPEQWTAWQFDRPELGTGLLQGIRHTACPAQTLTIRPHGLDPDADYLLDNPETGAQLTISGAALQQTGFTFDLPPRNGALWCYRRK